MAIVCFEKECVVEECLISSEIELDGTHFMLLLALPLIFNEHFLRLGLKKSCLKLSKLFKFLISCLQRILTKSLIQNLKWKFPLINYSIKKINFCFNDPTDWTAQSILTNSNKLICKICAINFSQKKSSGKKIHLLNDKNTALFLSASSFQLCLLSFPNNFTLVIKFESFVFFFSSLNLMELPHGI